MSHIPAILIVEDQKDIRDLIRATLEFEDFDLHEADNGMAGLHKALSLRPAVVLLDVMMPGELDGYQVCRKIKEAPDLRHTRVMLLTARGQQKDLAEGDRAGADAYLVKPFSPLDLIERIEAMLPAGSAA